MPPLAAAAIRGALDPSNRGGSGGSLLSRLSPAPQGGNSGSPSRIPVVAVGGRGAHQRTNGISVRGAAVPGNKQPRKKYIKNVNVELAGRAADDFVAVFYSNMDAASGRPELVKMYRPTSTLVWNGNKIQGLEALNDFFSKLPPSKHEIQMYDCHPIPGTEGMNSRKASLLLSISGTVVHGKDAIDNPPSRSATAVVDALPRVFSQTFVLSPDLEGSGLPPEQWQMVDRYYILSDHLRFIG
ncbi:NTF2-like protein [Calocera viscosa TUFC12733]|uniref:NTF2-like protein n=1 Tax=Calocera viscosa (strain TUFC12733) TaxID=1330018 RepID=A0A167M4M8_CALVF|nr:NTF2-like protein [Calocera viscosa TUFC12733]